MKYLFLFALSTLLSTQSFAQNFRLDHFRCEPHPTQVNAAVLVYEENGKRWEGVFGDGPVMPSDQRFSLEECKGWIRYVAGRPGKVARKWIPNCVGPYRPKNDQDRYELYGFLYWYDEPQGGSMGFYLWPAQITWDVKRKSYEYNPCYTPDDGSHR